jgi:hypothetical protein
MRLPNFLDRGRANQNDVKRKFLHLPPAQPGFPTMPATPRSDETVSWRALFRRYVLTTKQPGRVLSRFALNGVNDAWRGSAVALSFDGEAIVGSARVVSRMPMVKGGLEMTG